VVLLVIEETEKADLRAATTAASSPRGLARLAVGLVHGRLREAPEQVMQDSGRGMVQVLVAYTTVVGGYPNATIMLIERPETIRPGTAASVRGRIGRGAGENAF
jgi:RecG-like helicase